MKIEKFCGFAFSPKASKSGQTGRSSDLSSLKRLPAGFSTNSGNVSQSYQGITAAGTVQELTLKKVLPASHFNPK